MLNKVSSLARAVSIILAVIAGFVTLGSFPAGVLLVVLGLISGITMPSERMIGVGVSVLVLPAIGDALGMLPWIGDQLGLVARGIATTAAGALASAMAIYLFNMVKDELTSLTAKA
jgi:hypothetical protein